MLQPFFEWMQALPLSTMIQESWWMQAAINITHLLSLVFFIGGLIVVAHLTGRAELLQQLLLVQDDDSSAGGALHVHDS
jgi:hypothetical protein